MRRLVCVVLAALALAAPAEAKAKKTKDKKANVSAPADASDEEENGGDGKGGLTSKEILAVIRANLNQIRKCYEALLVRKPQAQGKVQTHFQIEGATGKVKAVTHESDKLDDPKFLGCIDDRIAAWTFPKPRGDQDVAVDYPFVFNPL